MNEYAKMLEMMEAGHASVLCREWTGEEGDLSDMKRALLRDDELSEGLAQEALEDGLPASTHEQDSWAMAEPCFGKSRLIVLGGGHVALPVVELGAKCGFQVTVVDDRYDFANPGRFPLAEKVVCDEFMKALRELKVTASDYVVIITRGHKYDEDCLRALLAGPEPAYLGMMGSKRRVAFVREKLLSEGADPARLERLYSPIGFKIGGIGPDEIAVSIIAEVISVRRLGRGDKKVRNRTDLDLDVLNLLAGETDVPKAVATVISSKGSSPRGAGAKMIIYRDGRLVGSIGGGCSEAEVLGPAREMIGTGTYRVFHVDMTAEEAEDEGSVCGGVMDILVEDVPVNQ